MKVLEIFKDKFDQTIKTVFKKENTSTIIDIDFIPNNTDKDIIRISAFTKDKEKINIEDMLPCICGSVVFTGDLEKNERRTKKEKLLIEITAKYSEISENLGLLKELNNNIDKLKKILGYKNIAFKIEITKEESIETIKQFQKEQQLPLFLSIQNFSNIRTQVSLYEYLKDNNNSNIDFENTQIEIVLDIKDNINNSRNRIIKILKECSPFNIPIVLTSTNNSVTEESINTLLNYLYNQGYTEKQCYFKQTMGIDVNSLDNITDEETINKWKVQHKIYELQRRDAIDWDTCFMSIARLIAMRSKDPHRQVGACIVGKDYKILSLGYNGAPVGIEDDEFPWGKIGDDLETKHMYVCHAEANAISNYNGNNKDMEGAVIYVDLFPCNECAKKIIQAKIGEVVYLSDKNAMKPSVIAAKRMFDKVGIKYRQLPKEKQKEITLDLVVKK